jgi:hypothetical protein
MNLSTRQRGDLSGSERVAAKARQRDGQGLVSLALLCIVQWYRRLRCFATRLCFSISSDNYYLDSSIVGGSPCLPVKKGGIGSIIDAGLSSSAGLDSGLACCSTYAKPKLCGSWFRSICESLPMFPPLAYASVGGIGAVPWSASFSMSGLAN